VSYPAEATHFSKYSWRAKRRDRYSSFAAGSERLDAALLQEEQFSSCLARAEEQMPDAYLLNLAIFQKPLQARFSDMLE
jgi:hypothetical protein